MSVAQPDTNRAATCRFVFFLVMFGWAFWSSFFMPIIYGPSMRAAALLATAGLFSKLEAFTLEAASPTTMH